MINTNMKKFTSSLILITLSFILILAGFSSTYAGKNKSNLKQSCPKDLITIEIEGGIICTHGEDTAGKLKVKPNTTLKSGRSTIATTYPTAPIPRIGDGRGGKRVHVLYVYAGTNNLATEKATILQALGEAEYIVEDSASYLGGSARVRWLLNTGPTGEVAVTPVQISSTAIATYGGTVQALQAQGYNRADRKYLMFVDATVYCGISGIYFDDRASPTVNDSNVLNGYSRADKLCWSGFVATHELFHALGAVQLSSPNSSGAAHCLDDGDVMCYQDGSGIPTTQVCTDPNAERRLDCNGDDYFNPVPGSGNYLNTHWNTSSSGWLSVSP